MTTKRLLLQPSPYAEDGGKLIGRDPRKLSLEEYRAAGIPPTGTMVAIRSYCLDCCAGQPGEVRKCVATSCQLWPFRMGVDVFHGKRPRREETGGIAADSGTGEAAD